MRTVKGAAYYQVGRGFNFKRLFHRGVNPGLGYIAKEAERGGIITSDQADPPPHIIAGQKQSRTKRSTVTKKKKAKKPKPKKTIKRKSKSKSHSDIFSK